MRGPATPAPLRTTSRPPLGVPPPSARHARLLALLAVVGPGLIAGLSDDDPAGITTYSVLGARYGYRLLWVLLLSTVALVLFQDLGARIGVVTGQGIGGLVRQRYGARAAAVAMVALVGANVGTAAAEFAGIAAGAGLFGVSRYVAVPAGAALVSLLVLRAGFRGVQRVLLGLSAVFVSYLAASILAHPDWGATVRGLVTPSMPLTSNAVVLVTATVGTTLAPWGLAFIQSYAVDKRLTAGDLAYLRIDVVTGAVLTGVIGLFVVVACAATLHAQDLQISDAAQAARALEPLAGAFAGDLFAVGLLGAALLAASIVPLSTAYALADLTGRPAALDDTLGEAPLFYGTFAVVTVAGAALVLVPGVPLVGLLVATQVVNAVLLLPLLAFLYGIARDRTLMGRHRATRRSAGPYLVTMVAITACVAALLVSELL